MSHTAMLEVHPGAKTGPIMIRPYFDPTVSNMGLEQYGLSLFDGVYHEEQIVCIEKNGVKRFVTGLNEFAPEIKLMHDEEKKQAIIKQIRTIVSQLEMELAANVIKVDDPDFWEKVKLLKPDNSEFWGKISLRCGNTPVALDPVKDPYDLIRLCAIEAGGFNMVAKSLEDARNRDKPLKFYLDKYEDTAITKTEIKKLKNKALSKLDQLYNKTPKKLFYVVKVIDSNGASYRKNTSNDVIYDVLDNYINGKSFETNGKRAAMTFLDCSDQDMETLRLRALIKDSTFYKVIATRPDGGIYHLKSNSYMGKNPADVLEYLKNPLNEAILMEITEAIEKHWNN